MIEVNGEPACVRFQRVAWDWLQSGEMTRTGYLLSPLEELSGYKYGFIYLLRIGAGTVKIGFSEHPQRRIRELQAQYGQHIRLGAIAYPIIEEYFANSRRQSLEKIRALHVCSPVCPQLYVRLDLRMLGSWLAR